MDCHGGIRHPPEPSLTMASRAAAHWIPRLQAWAEADPNIRLALLVGSQARSEMPADPLSDIDLALFVREPDRLLRSQEWVGRLGPLWTSHLEPNGLGTGEERRVLFADGQDVDFAVFPVPALGALVKEPASVQVLRRGFRPLVNKDAFDLSFDHSEAPPTRPSPSEFSNLVNDAWFHMVWTAKKLRRGELLTAVESIDGYLRSLLVRMARWHSLLRGREGLDVWHGTRFFERWADPRVLEQFPATVAGYDVGSAAGALRALRTLFAWLSDELAEALSAAPPLPNRPELSVYLERLLADLPAGSGRSTGGSPTGGPVRRRGRT